MALTTDGLIAEFFGGYANGGTAPPTTPTVPTTWDCLTTSTYDGVLTNYPDPLTSTEGWVGDGSAGAPYALQVGTGTHNNGVVLGSSTALLSGVSAFTIDTWCKTTGTAGAYPRVISKTAGDTTGFSLYFSGGVGWIGAVLKTSGSTLFDGQLSPSTDYRGVIHHVTLSYSDADDTLRLYLDGNTQIGSSVRTGGGTVSVGTDSTCIGNRVSDYARGWDGWIGTVRIYNKQLSTVEIQANYDAGILATTYSPPAASSDRSFLLARGIGIA